jgi:hypothetical protein
MSKLLIATFWASLLALAAVLLSEAGTSAVTAITGNDWASLILGSVSLLAGGVVLGSAPTLSNWIASVRARGGVYRWIAAVLHDLQPGLEAALGKLQSAALVVIWMAAAIAAAKYASQHKDFVREGGGTLMASFLVGWGAMLASFNAYLAAALKAGDDRRKDHREQKERRRNQLLLTEHVTRKVTYQVERALGVVIARNLEMIDNDDGTELIRASHTDAFFVETPPQMERIWDNLALLPPKVVDAVRGYTIELEEVQGHIRRSTPTAEQLKGDVGYLMDRDRIVTGYRAVLQHTEEALGELQFHLG